MPLTSCILQIWDLEHQSLLSFLKMQQKKLPQHGYEKKIYENACGVSV